MPERLSGGLPEGWSQASRVEILLATSQPSRELRPQHPVTLTAWVALPLLRALQLHVPCKISYFMRAHFNLSLKQLGSRFGYFKSFGDIAGVANPSACGICSTDLAFGAF